MTPEKLQKVAGEYLIYLSSINPDLKAERFDETIQIKSPNLEIKHTKWMCQEIINLVDDNELDKAYRWIGFVQGYFWAKGIYTIEQMRKHNTEES